MPEVSGMQDWHIDPEEETLNRMMIERKAGRSWADRVLKGRGSISVAELLRKEPVPYYLALSLFFEDRPKRPFVNQHVLVSQARLALFVIDQGLVRTIFWTKHHEPLTLRACHFKHPQPLGRAYPDGNWHFVALSKAPKLMDYILAQKEA